MLPQFIDPQAPALPQYLICIATLTVVDVIVMSGYTLFAASLPDGSANHDGRRCDPKRSVTMIPSPAPDAPRSY